MTDYYIQDAHSFPGGVEEVIRYIHGKWGRPQNYSFYRDAILNYGKQLPRFFVLCKAGEIVGCGALIVNDFISRHDLWPWYACHYIEAEHRGQGLGAILLEHGRKLAKELGFPALYLCTDHDGYYEKYGWQRIEDGYERDGEATRIYRVIHK